MFADLSDKTQISPSKNAMSSLGDAGDDVEMTDAGSTEDDKVCDMAALATTGQHNRLTIVSAGVDMLL